MEYGQECGPAYLSRVWCIWILVVHGNVLCMTSHDSRLPVAGKGSEQYP